MRDVLLESDQDGNHVREPIIRSFRRGNGNYDNDTISSYHQESNHRIYNKENILPNLIGIFAKVGVRASLLDTAASILPPKKWS